MRRGRAAAHFPFVGFLAWDAASERWLMFAEPDPRRPASAIILSDDIIKARRHRALTAEEFESGRVNPDPHHPDRPLGWILDPSNLRIGLGRGLVKRYGNALANMGDTYDEIARQFPPERAPVLFCELQRLLVMACEDARDWEATDADAAWRALDDSVKRGRRRLKDAAKAARTLAAVFADHPEMAKTFCRLAMERSNVFLLTMRSPGKGQPAEQIERIPALSRWLATLGEKIGDPAAGKVPWIFSNFYANLSFPKGKATVKRPDTATCLSFELAHLLRHFTGPNANHDRWAGDPMPSEEAPWAHVAAFANAAGLQRDSDEVLSERQCQEAVKNLLKRNPGVRLRSWGDGRRGATTPL